MIASFSHFTANSTIRPFGKSSRNIRSNSPLSDDQIRTVAPSIFADAPHQSRSARYSYIPTSEVLQSLRAEGFQPFAISQGGSRDEEKANFTKHMIRLRHESQIGAQVGNTFREIVLVNSHDGTSSYQLMSGIFRLVCTNGMVCSEGGHDEIRVKHSGDVRGAVIDGCIEILERMPEISERVAEWSNLKLTQPMQAAFAKAAMQLKYDADEPAPFDSGKLLTLKRREDAEPTLWNTLNVVQENVIRGGVGYVLRDENGYRKQIRRTREVKGIEQNVRLNKGLWTLAEEMRKIIG